MKKVIIFGAGGMGQEIFDEINKSTEVVSFWDNAAKEGQTLKGIPVVKPQKIRGGIDAVILGACYPSMVSQLSGLGIPDYLIDDKYVDRRINCRIKFLERFAQLAYERDMDGCVAEAGVFQGEFAQHINRVFPDRKLFLFDTFTGFSEEDIKWESKAGGFTGAAVGQYSSTAVEMVMEKMPFPQTVTVKPGYFPDTAKGIEEKFIFVNLDMDLYKPTLAGLEFFESRMDRNGVILIHDYFSHYKGVEQAVNQFLDEHRYLYALPIGDEISIAILGFRGRENGDT